ncbi:MAG: TIGR00730 family Rossman fold protein [Dysgonamonadaceae bacterium]|nr:TIGR00730 family Rossman fold protein [Dysgonamonadaceae bacterium]
MSEFIKTITIYGASSSKIDPEYITAAKQLGGLMARKGITCINGAGQNGIMGAVSEEMLAYGGRVIGIIPQFMIEEGWLNHSLTEVIVTPDMHSRKQLMAEKSDGCIALPGGVGTMEELLEMMTWKQLGLYKNPIIILNTNGYYNFLLQMLEKSASENFIHHRHQAMWTVAESPEEALELAVQKEEWDANPRSFAAI